MMKKSNARRNLIAAAVLLLHCGALATTFLSEEFEGPAKGWRKGIKKDSTASIDFVENGRKGKCLKITVPKALTAYYSRELPLEKVRGKKIIARVFTRYENVVQGSPSYCTAKLHIVYRAPGQKPQNFATRYVGTGDWQEKYLFAEIPKDATKVTFDLGIQDSTGTVWFDQLTIEDDNREHLCLPLKSIANTCLNDIDPEVGIGGFIDAGELDLRSFPTGYRRYNDFDFNILLPVSNWNRNCVVLGGRERPGKPLRSTTVLPVGAKGKRLLFLQASAWAKPAVNQHCLDYLITYKDGKTIKFPVNEGREIGSFTNPEDCPNWKVVWRGTAKEQSIGVGITEWRNPRPEVEIAHIRPVSTGKAGVPIILAITLEPLKPPTKTHD